MMVASIEATLEPWASSLRDVKARMRSPFTRERVAVSAGRFLDGLPGDGRRKTGWMRAEAAGDPGPWRQQAILGRGRWDADALRDIVREYTLETPSDADAVLVIDGTGFLKQGRASCGVGRQHAGPAGKITNCRIGVLAACVSRHGHAFIDRALHLPKVWTDDRARMAAVHVAQETRLATKPAIALAMIERTLGADMAFSRVAADGACGVGAIETVLRRAGKGHVPGVNARHLLHSWARPQAVGGIARDGAGGLDETAWHRLSAGDGTKGERLHEWACLDLADLDIDECDTAPTGLWTRGLPIRRNIADGDLAFFSTWCPAGTAIDTLVGVEGHRRAIEDSFETAGNGLGLDHDETRSRHGRHRHVPLVMPAFAMMATIRHHAMQHRPQERCAGQGAGPATDPLVGPGNPAHCHTPRPTADPSRTCHRMAALAKGTSSPSARGTHQIKNATVVLARRSIDDRFQQQHEQRAVAPHTGSQPPETVRAFVLTKLGEVDPQIDNLVVKFDVEGLEIEAL